MSLSTPPNIQTNVLNNVTRRQQKAREGVRQRPIRSIIASDSSNSKIIYVYCSPKLKNALTCILRLIVVAYCITVPLFVYLLYKESTDNIEKLSNLERQLSGHLKGHLKKRFRGDDTVNNNKIRRSYISTTGNKSLKIGQSYFLKNYKVFPKLKVNLNREIKKLNEKVMAYGNRMKKMSSAERWIYDIYTTYVLPNITSVPKKNCSCDKEGSFTAKEPVSTTIDPERTVDNTGLNVSTTYIRWGSASCKGSHTKKVYSGFMSGALPLRSSFMRKKGGGVNYLCLPNHPKYGENEPGRNEHRTYIDGVIYGQSFKNINNLANKVIQCTLCESMGKSVTIMIPGTNACHKNWSLEYTGFISTGGKQNQRTEYVCLDLNTKNSTAVNHVRNTIGSLDTVSVKCMEGILPCGDGKNQYKNDTVLSCVVCSR